MTIRRRYNALTTILCTWENDHDDLLFDLKSSIQEQCRALIQLARERGWDAEWGTIEPKCINSATRPKAVEEIRHVRSAALS